MSSMGTVETQEIFGTDGIRGKALEGWLSVQAVEALGRAAGAVLGPGSGHAAEALIAHDGRASAKPLEEALGRGLRASGVIARTAGLLPTPGLAWLTATEDVSLGVMISASHNPAEDNGIKLFAGGGSKLTDAQQAEIEMRLREEMERVSPGGEVAEELQHDDHLEDLYAEHLIALAKSGEALDLAGTKVVIDCANGAASHVGPRVLKAIGAEVTTLYGDPNGTNINDGCGSTYPEPLQERVKSSGADFGVALDGDADRCLLVDENGALVDGDAIMAILARDAAERGLWDDPRIVATVMSNRGLHRALEPVGVSVVEVGVGDRQVVEGLREHGLHLGGEKSGHIIFGADSGFIGDGLLTALHVLSVRARTGKTLSELAAPFVPFPQVLLGLRVASKPSLDRLPLFQEKRRAYEEELGKDGRVNVRYSGTEPKARVMIEGADAARIQEIADDLVEALREEISAQTKA
ncbi:MAG: phosphoglucosamine mutase [Planctomycetota bacterium]|jgi:phosphoglucosamine mutase